MKMRWLLLVCLATGCADRSLGQGEDPQAHDQNDPHVGCTGAAPYCVDACGSDWLMGSATCVDNDWSCPSPLLRTDQCPPGTCWGPPASDAEECTPQGWTCEPKPQDYVQCPAFLCPECGSFTTQTVGNCTCSCTGNAVTCERAIAVLDPTARFFFSWGGGAVASGGGVEVLGDGTIHGWLPSPTTTIGPPDWTGSVPPGDVADLFARFHAVDRTTLPHLGGGAECYVAGSVSDCAGCSEATLGYSTAPQVLPEMDATWHWFTEHPLPGFGPYSPATFCNF